MSNQAPQTITKFDCLYAVRTGLTVLLPKHQIFDDSKKTPPAFSVSPENPCDIVIKSGDQKVLLKGLKKEHLEASVSRGFIMFYEMEDDDVIRSTICNYQKN